MRNILILLFTLSFMSVFAQQKYFDPDGYYFPETKCIIGGIKIDNLNVHSLDYYFNGKLDYDNPKIVKPEIIISQLGSKKRLFATDIIINKDRLFFHINLSKEKVIEFDGKFIDKRGQYWNQDDIEPQKTIIMKGTFRLLENGIIKEKKDVKFTFWEGD